MSNQVNFVRTEFKNYLGTNSGFQAYDDYEETYGYNMETPTSPDKDAGFIKYIYDNQNDVLSNLFEGAQENGAYIDGIYYDADEFSKLLIPDTENKK